jgi:hypothetical protein
MRVGLQAALFAVLVAVAIVYFSVPSRAAESCRGWVAEMQEDEGGPVLTAHACSDDSTQTWLAMTCHEGTIRIDHDMALGGNTEPGLAEETEVEFVTDGGVETVPMQFQEMNAMFAGSVAANGKLVDLLRSNQSVLVRDSAGRYPARTYSLKGSSAALETLVSACR